MWKGNPVAVGLLTLLDCPIDASTWKAFGGNWYRLICMLCCVWKNYYLILNVTLHRSSLGSSQHIQVKSQQGLLDIRHHYAKLETTVSTWRHIDTNTALVDFSVNNNCDDHSATNSPTAYNIRHLNKKNHNTHRYNRISSELVSLILRFLYPSHIDLQAIIQRFSTCDLRPTALWSANKGYFLFLKDINRQTDQFWHFNFQWWSTSKNQNL